MRWCLVAPCLLTACGRIGFGETSTPGDDAASPEQTWSTAVGGTGFEHVHGLAVAGGAAYYGGHFGETASFGTTSLVTVGSEDAFLARIDASGEHRWAVGLGTPGNDETVAVATDGTHVYALGFTSQSMFVASYTDAGEVRWMVDSTGTGSVEPWWIVVAGNDVVAVGSFAGTVDLGPGSITSAMGSKDAFVVAYDRDSGTPRWKRVIGGPGADVARVIATIDGDILVGGGFEQTIDPGLGTITSAGLTDAWLARYAVDGTPRWAKRYGDLGSDVLRGIAVAPNGSIVIAGTFQTSIDLGTGAIAAVDPTSAFVAWLAGDAAGQSARAFHATNASSSSIAVAARDDAVFLTGMFMQADFGGGELAAVGASDAFIASITPTEHRWTRSLGGAQTDVGTAIALDASGGLWCVGWFQETATTDLGVVTSAGGTDGYILRIAAP